MSVPIPEKYTPLFLFHFARKHIYNEQWLVERPWKCIITIACIAFYVTVVGNIIFACVSL